MFKVIFILVLATDHGWIHSEMKFDTLNECETAGEQIVKNVWKTRVASSYTCIEKHVKEEKKKKIKCSIENRYDYVNNHTHNSNAGSMDGYPYPTSFTCIEE